MNIYVQQSISINHLKITNITNSSVLQIGSAGIIKPASHLFNTGGFTEAAPQASTPNTQIQESAITLVPSAITP
ncbi:spore germination protein GerPB [Bacillus tuaregi]|uniref:spore germination protein GerPB n=1 Tax=Bacillus tuaregi TaxID=1816695 RepID=UPI0008F8EF34|nr:spore germination protein GerPB [Bacillus tuaregi]